jgi:hypothetical protein
MPADPEGVVKNMETDDDILVIDDIIIENGMGDICRNFLNIPCEEDGSPLDLLEIISFL